MITINGDEMKLDDISKDAITIAGYLDLAGFIADKVVVEKNLEIIPKEDYGTVLLEDGDTIEVLSFVGGG